MLYDAYINNKERLDINMPMGTSACYADVIDVKEVKKIVPIAFRNFLKVLKQQQVSLEKFAAAMNCEECENEKNLDAWMFLSNAFERATMPDHKTQGLTLRIGYHDKSENGDHYDEVDGVFFHVDGVYELTPAGKKFDKVINRRYYTEFG